MVQFVLYGGKGGAGKTTLAAATGLALAGEGRETLVVSTDPAHSLGDVLDADLGDEPRRVREHLRAVEVDPATGRATYRTVVEALADELRGVGVRLDPEDVEALFAAGAVPGGDELAAVERLVASADADRWSHVVFDTAPTGQTLRLLELPDVLRTAVEEAGSLRAEVRRLAGAARTAVLGPAGLALGGPDGAEDELEAVRERMARARALLRDPAVTEFRVVGLPEAMAVAETGRLVERLRAFGVPVRTLVVNRVLRSVHGDCDRCRRRRESQRAHLAELRRLFPKLEVWVVPEVGPEVTNGESLAAVASAVAE